MSAYPGLPIKAVLSSYATGADRHAVAAYIIGRVEQRNIQKETEKRVNKTIKYEAAETICNHCEYSNRNPQLAQRHPIP